MRCASHTAPDTLPQGLAFWLSGSHPPYIRALSSKHTRLVINEGDQISFPCREVIKERRQEARGPLVQGLHFQQCLFPFGEVTKTESIGLAQTMLHRHSRLGQDPLLLLSPSAPFTYSSSYHSLITSHRQTLFPTQRDGLYGHCLTEFPSQ